MIRHPWIKVIIGISLGAAAIFLFGGFPRNRKPAEIVAPPIMPTKMPLFRPAGGDREKLPAIVRANNTFAFSLYNRMRNRPGNLVVSPACLSAGLALVHTGARSETAKQIARVLRLPDDLAQPDRAYAALIQELNADAEDSSYQIRLANNVWFQEGYPFLDSYRATLKNVFALDGASVDFSGRPDEACRVINAWTDSRTGGKISGMLRPADLPSRTRLILTAPSISEPVGVKGFKENARFRKPSARPGARRLTSR